jgi:tetraacyldisaccharide 4'-kinase
MTLADRVWYGNDGVGRAARAVLAPLSAAYRAGAALRNALFDRGLLAQHAVALPSVSVGNLSVGGTGKTPVAAWLSAQLAARGARPALVLRGYGGDEVAVHQELNPAVPVIVDANRVRGIARARERGCDVAVLDDAFQHRGAARAEDVVLISADRWSEPARTLPAGPYREPVSALRRATLVIVTRKAVPAEEARELCSRLAPGGDAGRGAVVALRLEAAREVHGERAVPLERLRGERLLVVAGVGDPHALHAQLRALDAHIDLLRFADHRHYSRADVRRIVDRAASSDRVLCTLKDAVKLRELWPRQAPLLWYFSLRVEVEHGMPLIDDLLGRLLGARRLTTSMAAG